MKERLTETAERLLATAKRHLDIADENGWLAAEAVWKAHREEGVAQREIARRLGKALITVQRYLAIWEAHGVDSAPSHSFAEAFAALPGSRPADRRAREMKHLLQSEDEDDDAALAQVMVDITEQQWSKLFMKGMEGQTVRRDAESRERQAADPPSAEEQEKREELGKQVKEFDVRRDFLHPLLGGLRELQRTAERMAKKWVEGREELTEEDRTRIVGRAREVNAEVNSSLAEIVGVDEGEYESFWRGDESGDG